MKRGGQWTIAAVAALLLVWGSLIEPRLLHVRREDAAIPGLPAGWEGARVAALGDFQLGMWLDNDGTIAAAVREILRSPPRAVLLLGDFIYAQEGEPLQKLAEVKELLRPLVDAGVPTYAVLGNHDYGQDTRDDEPVAARAQVVHRGLEEIGIRVLQNEAIAIRDGGDPVYLVGIAPEWTGVAAPEQALAQVPAGAPRVVFMHNPLSFRQIVGGAAPLAIAAHTHGGQVRIPFLPHWSWLTLVRGTDAVDGWIEPEYGEAGNRLYVNRGIGFSTIPIRINCRPELTVFTLRGGKPAAPRRDEPGGAVVGADPRRTASSSSSSRTGEAR